MPMWIGIEWALAGLEAEERVQRGRAARARPQEVERAARVRVWTVSAVVVEQAGPPTLRGAVVAADLELAASQMCLYLKADLVGRGYLLAVRDTAGVVAARLVATLIVDPATGAVTHEEWTAADAASR
ncbi:hypothetical protein [Streptomyces roseolus]|uniref:hypothetical protein n=1 Tax=Streptomyces roseolus TaxID=67358 RepID=UPI0036513CA6